MGMAGAGVGDIIRFAFGSGILYENQPSQTAAKPEERSRGVDIDRINTPSPLLSLRRSEAADAHRELEMIINIGSVLHRVEDHARLLAKFYGFYRAAEQALESVNGLPLGKYNRGQRRKSSWLAQDLRELGWSRGRITDMPSCGGEDFPHLPDTAAAMGCAYVMEGSTLGGRQISIGLTGNEVILLRARRFFQSHGEKTGSRWLEFLKALADFGVSASPEQFERVARAARRTFQRLGCWIKRGAL